MTKEEMFDWLEANNASIHRHQLLNCTREDGSKFYSNFTLCSNGRQWAAKATLAEAVEHANEILQERTK